MHNSCCGEVAPRVVENKSSACVFVYATWEQCRQLLPTARHDRVWVFKKRDMDSFPGVL